MAHELAPGVSVSEAALQHVVVHAVESVGGVRVRRPRRGLELAVAGGRVRVALELAAGYGAVLPELARAVQESVGGALRTICGLEPDAVDVRVEELE